MCVYMSVHRHRCFFLPLSWRGKIISAHACSAVLIY